MCLPRVMTGSLKVCYFPFKFRFMNMIYISVSPPVCCLYLDSFERIAARTCVCVLGPLTL